LAVHTHTGFELGWILAVGLKFAVLGLTELHQVYKRGLFQSGIPVLVRLLVAESEFTGEVLFSFRIF
jgi:hypothetical protein